MAYDFNEDDPLSLDGEVSPVIRLIFNPNKARPDLNELIYAKPIRMGFERPDGGETETWCMVIRDLDTDQKRSLPLNAITPYDGPETSWAERNEPSEIAGHD